MNPNIDRARTGMPGCAPQGPAGFTIAAILAVLIVFLMPTPATSQPPFGTTENPEGAVRLRTIFSRLGGAATHGSLLGMSAVGLGDVDSDGYDDISVRVGLTHWIFLGGDPMSTEPAQILEGTGWSEINDPVVGDFLGTDTNLYGYFTGRADPDNGVVFVRMTFYRWDTDSMMVPTELKLSLDVQPASERFMAADLDLDGDDELVFVNREERDAVVRIYEGGGSFSLDAPTIELRRADSVVSSGNLLTFYSSIADFDGDGNLDLNIGKFNTLVASQAQEVWFWWGEDGTMPRWNGLPDRIIASTPTDVAPLPNWALIPEDVDGDSVAEVFGLVRSGDRAGTYLWLSRGRESARTREFSEETVDITFPSAGRNRGFGYIADSLQRYEMMTLLGGRDAYGFGGGLYGPNKTYDAHFGGGDGPAFGGVDAGDVNGDGWRDRLIASPTYGGPGVGIAVVVAGGPYIPVDDPTVSVRSEPVAGEPGGLKLWPNPARDRVTIAWRGDLERMPHRMVLVDIHGRTLLDRGLPTWKGMTALDLSRYPASSYRLLLYDIDGAMIAATNLILSK